MTADILSIVCWKIVGDLQQPRVDVSDTQGPAMVDADSPADVKANNDLSSDNIRGMVCRQRRLEKTQT